MLGEPDITKVVPGEGNLGVVDGRLRRTGDNYLYFLGAESPHIPVSGTYQDVVVRFSWHAHSDYSGPQITNMEWGFWRSDGMWWEVEVLCYGGGTDLYGTVDKDISSEVNQAIVEGCTWITLGFCFNDGRSDDWNQYVEIDDITATTGTSRTTAASATTVTRSTTITLWTTATAPLTTRIITTTLTATPPVTTRSITITVTGTPLVTTPTITTTVTVVPPLTTATETAIPPMTVTITTTVTATPPVTNPNITTTTVTAGESTASQTVTYATYTTYTMTTTATVTSSLTYSRTIGGTVMSATPFYSGVLVGVLATLIIVFGLFFLMRTKGKFRVQRFRLPKLRVPRIQSKPSKSDVHAEPIYKTLDDRVLEYIMSNKGTIGVTKASQDLGVEADFIRDAIQRLQRDGKLEPM